MDRKSCNCLSNHGLVLVALGSDRGIRIRELALRIGLTERTTQRIVSELVDAGMVERTREGRRNLYRLRREQPLQHTLEEHRTVGDLVDAFTRAHRVA